MQTSYFPGQFRQSIQNNNDMLNNLDIKEINQSSSESSEAKVQVESKVSNDSGNYQKQEKMLEASQNMDYQFQKRTTLRKTFINANGTLGLPRQNNIVQQPALNSSKNLQSTQSISNNLSQQPPPSSRFKNQQINQQLANNANATTSLIFGQHSKTLLLDQKQLKLIRQKQINQALEKLHRDIVAYKDFYLKIRKEYDRITIYENMFSRQRDQEREFKALKKNIKRIVEKFFLPVFPQYQVNAKIRRETKKTRQKKDNDDQTDQEQKDLLYDPEFQAILSERIQYFEEDSTVHLIQLAYFHIINFLEKIIETELYILEGTGISGSIDSMDILTFHGRSIQAKTMVKEQQQILKFLRLERFVIFLFWNFGQSLSIGVSPPVKERDFIYKRCMGSLKRLRQLIYSVNYLITTKKRRQLFQCYNNIRTFLMNTIQMMIDNLSQMSSSKNDKNFNSEPKHMLLLKTLYGMSDEMLSKNFLEDKKTNQKNLFDKDNNENAGIESGRAQNLEDLIQSLKEQLDFIDFVDEEIDVEEVSEILVKEQGIKNSRSANQLQKQMSQLIIQQQKDLLGSDQQNYQSVLNLNSVQQIDEKSDNEEFFKELGFKDPFHKQLFADPSQPKIIQDQQQISNTRFEYPLKQFISDDNLGKVNELLEKNPSFSTILANLLFSANNPFQEGFPFVHDTSFKNNFAKMQQKNLQKKGTMRMLFQDEDGSNSDDEQPLDMLSIIEQLDGLYPERTEEYRKENKYRILMDCVINDEQSIYSNSERFEKIVNSDFTFDKKYGNDKLEEKYAEIIRQQREKQYKQSKQSEMYNSSQDEQKNEVGFRFEMRDSSNGSLSKILQNKKQNSSLFDQIEDNLNPYKKKRLQSSFISNGKKTETNGSSSYWRRFSSSIESSMRDSRLQSLASLSGRRLSASLGRRKKLGFHGAMKGGKYTTEEQLLSEQEEDYQLFNSINDPDGNHKKRSATILVKSSMNKIGNKNQRHQQSLAVHNQNIKGLQSSNMPSSQSNLNKKFLGDNSKKTSSNFNDYYF